MRKCLCKIVLLIFRYWICTSIWIVYFWCISTTFLYWIIINNFLIFLICIFISLIFINVLTLFCLICNLNIGNSIFYLVLYYHLWMKCHICALRLGQSTITLYCISHIITICIKYFIYVIEFSLCYLLY